MDKRMPSLGGGLVAVAAAVIIFWGLRSLAFILAPLAMAMVITIAIIPLPGWLTKKGVKPGLSLILTILAVVGSLALVVFITLASLGKLAGVLPSYTANLAAQSSTLESLGASLGLIQTGTPVTSTAVMTSTVSSQLSQSLAGLNLSGLTAPAPSHNSDLAGAIVVAMGKMVAQVFFVLFIFVFMLSAALSFQDSKRIAGLSADSKAVTSVQEFTADVRQYVNIMAVINFLVALGNSAILGLLGIPFALLWGILSFFMGFIPSIGWWISLIPPFLIAWAQFGVGTAVIVLVSYVLINGGVQNIVQPKMMGKGLRISPLVVFISVIFWATVLGGMGALIAVPMTMIIIKILESTESTRWIAGVMRIGSGSDEEEEKQSFERLRGLAGKVRGVVPFGGRAAEQGAVEPQVAGAEGGASVAL